ncbi:MAG: FAD:protein FMN transferase [Spirochaetes bacterium]|nr:FAD:protein FMN transferase [Spirochaetota bacterium]
MLISVLLPMLTLVSCKGSVIQIGRPMLGTIVNLTFVGDPDKAPQVAQDVFAEIERVEKLMSPSVEGSDVFRINREAVRGPVRVSGETYELLRTSYDISAETGGCFDVTFAPLGVLWDYKKKDFLPPARSAVAALLPLVDYRKLVFDQKSGSVSFARPGMRIGLGGIAKGHAVRMGIQALKRRGIHDAIVEAGGDLQAIGAKFDRPWITGLRNPRKDAILLTLELEDMDAVATSGDYERFVVRRGVRYHHIIDPRVGYPASGFSSVTVISKNPVLSDAYATAIFVMGPAAAREFLKRHDEIDVILVDDKIDLFISSRLKGRVVFLDRVKSEWL